MSPSAHPAQVERSCTTRFVNAGNVRELVLSLGLIIVHEMKLISFFTEECEGSEVDDPGRPEDLKSFGMVRVVRADTERAYPHFKFRENSSGL